MNIHGFPPRCYLIGAQKAGTTFLAGLLDQHPAIQVSTPKETDFYTGRLFENGFDWYHGCFPDHGEKILIDASTSYSAAYPLSDPRSKDTTISFNGVADRIAHQVPEARILYIIRNPVKRTYSAYYHFVRTGEETRTFKEVISSNNERREYYYLLSDYAAQLEHYLRHFPREQIKVIVFEEFIKAPQEHLRSCFHFLGIDDAPIDFSTGKHASFQYSGPLHRMNRVLAPWGGLRPILGKVKKMLPERLVEQAMRATTRPIPEMDQRDNDVLIEYFQSRIQKLETLLDRPLAKLWLDNGQQKSTR